MPLLQYFARDLANVYLENRVCVTEDDEHQRDGKLTAYCQGVNYTLAMYATDEVIAEAEAKARTQNNRNIFLP